LCPSPGFASGVFLRLRSFVRRSNARGGFAAGEILPVRSRSDAFLSTLKLKTLILLLLTAALAAGMGWQLGRLHQPAPSSSGASVGANARKIAYYQSPMHPWIKSDQPGKCTICGMDLVPVYEVDPQTAPGVGHDPNALTLAPGSIRAAGIASEPVRRGPLARTLEVSGAIDDDETRHRYISAYASGRVESLAVRYIGAEVTAGQPMATFYSPDLIVAQQEFIGANTGPDKRGAVFAREKLRRMGLSAAQIDDLARRGARDSNNIEILAPLSGTVIERQVYEGQWVNAGDRLFTLADFSTMWFQFDAYERDVPWLKVGQMVEIVTEADPGRVYRAPIAFIDPNFNAMTRSTKVRVEIENKDNCLPHRVYARGRVNVGGGEPVLLAPRAAVLNTGERAVAYVDRGGGNYEARTLRLGRAGDRDYEILSGLSEGERVVSAGNLLIDAQAQLSRESQPVDASEPDRDKPAAISQGLSALLDQASAAAAALADDDLTRYRQMRPALRAAAQAVESDALKTKAAAMGNEPTDLGAARREFEPLSTALAEAALTAHRQQPATFAYKIYECPMAPNVGRALWVQREGPLRNPYLGRQMLTCGVEMK
jgi:Cu(I)/Ag(I) efflux system membrane fusion protein